MTAAKDDRPDRGFTAACASPDVCMCPAFDADSDEQGWRPCPPNLCEREDHERPHPSPFDVTGVYGVERAEILDACCGGRMWWWDKEHPLALYMDNSIRGAGSHSTRPNWKCEPDMVADFRNMPFPEDSFQLVVFDPPHLTRRDAWRAENPTGNTLACYGVLHAETEQDDLRRGFSECWRVLRPGGTLVFKWAGELSRVRPHFPAVPIVGTKTLRKGSGLGTRWIIFYKPPEGVAASVAA